MKTVGILLCAGASRRFGPKNKLLADLRGQPLVAHAAGTLRKAGFERLVAVTGEADVAHLLSGFEVVAPDTPQPDQADSLRAGIRHASGADRALLVLGDMPFVSPAHLLAVVEMAGIDGTAASTDGTRRSPPACFPARRFGDLAALSGDQGARVILRALPCSALVRTDAGALLDIDTPADLVRANRMVQGASVPGNPPRH